MSFGGRDNNRPQPLRYTACGVPLFGHLGWQSYKEVEQIC